MAAINSFPDVHISGPVHHFVRAKNSSSGNPGIWFLGTCEVTPQMRKRRYKSDVKNTIAGQQLPFQRTYDGQAATVSALLNRFSKTALDMIRGSDVNVGNTPAIGQESRWSRGHAVFGQSDFELWQIYDNFFNPFGASINLEIGWYWPQVELLDDDTMAAGTLDEKQLCVFDCTPQWIPQASYAAVNAGKNERGWFLFSQDDTNLTHFPADVRVPQ